MKIGILTGGGDCPGLNAVIRAVVRKGSFHYDDKFVGFLEGWRGLVEDKSMPLDLQAVAGSFALGPKQPKNNEEKNQTQAKIYQHSPSVSRINVVAIQSSEAVPENHDSPPRDKCVDHQEAMIRSDAMPGEISFRRKVPPES